VASDAKSTNFPHSGCALGPVLRRLLLAMASGNITFRIPDLIANYSL
jgi:hypothetical protein